MRLDACLRLHTPCVLTCMTDFEEQVFGIFSILVGMLCFIPSAVGVNWPGAIMNLAVGIPATVASSAYNPCKCMGCACRGTGSSGLKTTAILCIVAAVAASGGIVGCEAIIQQVASWGPLDKYVCCPADAMELTEDSCFSAVHGGAKAANKACSSPTLSQGKSDCIVGGPYPPYAGKEPRTCFDDRVPVEEKLDPTSKTSRKLKEFHRALVSTVTGWFRFLQGLFALTLLEAVAAAFFTWKEAAQAQKTAVGPA